MKKYSLLLLLSLLLPIASFAQRTITVMGDGSAKTSPDFAVISMTVTVQDNSVQTAFGKNDEIASKLRAVLATNGVQNSDVEMKTYALNPTYDYSQPTGSSPKLVGYHFIGSYSAKVTNLKDIGKVLDAANSAGATNINVESYGSSKAESLEEKALKNAIEDAREKAERLAKEMGATLGEIISITDAEAMEKGGSGGSSFDRREEEERRGMAGRLNIKDVTRTAEVKVTFAVK
jgi:hypothetical protein